MGASMNEVTAMAALDAAVATIQEALGVKTGDAAAQFFSGPRGDYILDIFKDYIKFEEEQRA